MYSIDGYHQVYFVSVIYFRGLDMCWGLKVAHQQTIIISITFYNREILISFTFSFNFKSTYRVQILKQKHKMIKICFMYMRNAILGTFQSNMIENFFFCLFYINICSPTLARSTCSQFQLPGKYFFFHTVAKA